MPFCQKLWCSKFLGIYHKCSDSDNSFNSSFKCCSGWPHTLENRENRENGEKKSLQGKSREFEILLKIREKSGNFKKSYLCKVKIFKFYSCSDVATGGFFLFLTTMKVN